MLGISSKLREIREIAESQGNIPIVEDNCEAIGATYQNKKLGTIGELGVLSFDQGKMIATGEGGMILTNDRDLDRIAREYHDHGHENNPLLPRGRDTRTKPGFNYRMTELQAAIGKVQLSKLDKMLAENKKRYMVLQKNLSKEFKIRGTPSDSEASWDTLIVFEENHKRRDQFIKILYSEGFGTKNLPDAMEWHCSKFWNHALPKKQILRGNKTHKILETAIAIPIWLRKSITEYENLAKKLIET